MSWRKIFLAIVVAGTASWMIAQETRTYSKETTVQSSDGTKTVTISGEVVRYEPGQTIVLRDRRAASSPIRSGRMSSFPPRSRSAAG